MRKYVIGNDSEDRFYIDPYDGGVEFYDAPESALAGAARLNGEFNGFTLGADGLVMATPWKVYELREVAEVPESL